MSDMHKTSNMIEPMRRPRRTIASVRRSVAQTAKESTMVFKEGTFKGEQPEHFEGPHPAWLETAVADALSTAGDIDASDISVTCKGTRIILTGSVGTPEEGTRAVEIAASVKDVSEVDSRLSWL
jgi:osmotically-inducible protein OsmY